jgi:hypothetical protein
MAVADDEAVDGAVADGEAAGLPPRTKIGGCTRMPWGAAGLVCTRKRFPARWAAAISSAVVNLDLVTKAFDSARAFAAS